MKDPCYPATVYVPSLERMFHATLTWERIEGYLLTLKLISLREIAAHTIKRLAAMNRYLVIAFPKTFELLGSTTQIYVPAIEEEESGVRLGGRAILFSQYNLAYIGLHTGTVPLDIAGHFASALVVPRPISVEAIDAPISGSDPRVSFATLLENQETESDIFLAISPQTDRPHGNRPVFLFSGGSEWPNWFGMTPTEAPIVRFGPRQAKTPRGILP